MNDFRYSPEQFLEAWGWENPPEPIVEQAHDAARFAHRGPVDLLVERGLCEDAVGREALARKPASSRELDWLIGELPGLKSQAQRLTATLAGIEYADLSKPFYVVSTDRMGDKDVSKECREYRAVLVDRSGGRAALVFSDQSYLREYQQLVGVKASSSVLRTRYPELRLCLGERDAVTRIIDNLSQEMLDDDGASVTILRSEDLKASEDTKLVDDIHSIALDMGGTDIHVDVTTNGKVTFELRVRGDMERMTISATVEEYLRLVKYLLKNSKASKQIGPLRDPCDGRYQYIDGIGNIVNVRASFIPSPHIMLGIETSVSVSLRLIPMNTGQVKLEEKGVRADVIKTLESAIRPGDGLILLVGPTNTGKSTTIAGMIGQHRQIYGDRKNRLSAEDPVERFIEGVKQFEVPVARRGKDGFATLAKNFMRHDPDLIFLGEVRDSETAEYATQFAESGHLVMSSLHSRTPENAINRIINLLPPDKPALRMAALGACSLIVGQRLVKELCPHCRVQRELSDEESAHLDYLSKVRGRPIRKPSRVFSSSGKACGAQDCKKGVIGQLPINQTLVMTNELRRRIGAQNADIEAIAAEGVTITFDAMTVDYMEEGRVSFDAINY